MNSVPYPMANWPGMNQQHAIEFLAAEDGTGIDGWHWLIEWSTTSFYIKSLNPALPNIPRLDGVQRPVRI